MEITIDLETCKIIVHFQRYNSYAIFYSKVAGNAVRLSIPELIIALEQASKQKLRKQND